MENYIDVLELILAQIADIRPCLLVSRRWRDCILKMPDVIFWKTHCLNEINIYMFGSPKMLELIVPTIKNPNIIAATCDNHIMVEYFGGDRGRHLDLAGASRLGYIELVKYLHQHGNDIAADDNVAVKCAARNGHLDIVRYLHNNGADVSAEDNYAIRWSMSNCHNDVTGYLRRYGART